MRADIPHPIHHHATKYNTYYVCVGRYTYMYVGLFFEVKYPTPVHMHAHMVYSITNPLGQCSVGSMLGSMGRMLSKYPATLCRHVGISTYTLSSHTPVLIFLTIDGD